MTTGQKVNHKKFGNGTITAVADGNITIDFGGTTKTLIAAYANLKEGHVAPKVKKVKTKITFDNVQDLKTGLLLVNRRYADNIAIFNHTVNKIANAAIGGNNQWVLNILDAATEHRSISEKDAYAVAAWANDNGVK